MHITDSVAEHILKDFDDQNIKRLAEWSLNFPNAWDVIFRHRGADILKQALVSEQLLLAAFLIRERKIPRKQFQISESANDASEHCIFLIQSHVHKLPKQKLRLLKDLQEMVAL